MRLEQLQQIIVIEKCASISKAAKALYMAQPTLSNSLHRFESEIGVKIFERTAAGVVPTAEGRDILHYAKQVIDNCEQISRYKEYHGELSGHVRVLMTQAFNYILPEILVAFKEKFPKAALSFATCGPVELVEAMGRGDANIGMTLWGVLSDQKLCTIEKYALHYETFAEHEMMLYVSAQHPLAGEEEVEVETLRDEQFVMLSANYWRATNTVIQANGEAMLIEDVETLQRLVIKNQAVAVLPDTFAWGDVNHDNGLYKTIPIKDGAGFAAGTEYLLYPSKRQLTLLEEKTIELLQGILKRK